MLTLASPLPVTKMVWALLLLAASLSAQRGSWDNPTCTKGVVSVSRGEHAIMACNISNPFSRVTICLRPAPGKDCQHIFREVAPGHLSWAGWQLRVQGGVAQLVIEDASDAQAGQYKWHLQGRQRSVATTTLNVSEPEDLLFTPSSGPELPRPLSEVGSQSDVVLVILVIVTLSILVVGMWAWYRSKNKFGDPPASGGEGQQQG
ncbi:PREDICTED: secreted and transmembrane protein 1 [Ceratotherium simum simum]|uniref:Secreted and transmembrane protein 1 n=1 Tax=Ceratotherium simum simum TaxID=73337 RepID=A0ABM1CZC8_CERSS|nr:PREDICTED: secreted and transmembrane protein 1 [Ceratotherium simum simum]